MAVAGATPHSPCCHGEDSGAGGEIVLEVEGDWVRGEKGRDQSAGGGEGEEEEDEDNRNFPGRGLAGAGTAVLAVAAEMVGQVEAGMVDPVVADCIQEEGGGPCYKEVH